MERGGELFLYFFCEKKDKVQVIIAISIHQKVIDEPQWMTKKMDKIWKASNQFQAYWFWEYFSYVSHSKHANFDSISLMFPYIWAFWGHTAGGHESKWSYLMDILCFWFHKKNMAPTEPLQCNVTTANAWWNSCLLPCCNTPLAQWRICVACHASLSCQAAFHQHLIHSCHSPLLSWAYKRRPLLLIFCCILHSTPVLTSECPAYPCKVTIPTFKA